jgi:UDPglucose 6-dehydrogenase
LTIIDALLESGAEVVAYDPAAAEHVRERYKDNAGIRIVDDKYATLEGAAALLIATEWPEFVEADLQQIKQGLEQPLIFDGRNIFKPAAMREAGFTYYSIGRQPVTS